MRSPKETVLRVLLALLSLALGLAVLEVLARHFERPGGKGVLPLDQYIEYDPVLGWRKKAAARVLFDEPEYRVEEVINSKGLRGPERDYESDHFRILALGDSFAEGYTVGLSETMEGVLEARLGTSSCPVEVLNGGTAGYSSDQEYLFYRDEGKRYRPAVVVLLFYFNDVIYNLQPRYSGGVPKPLLVPGNDGTLLLTNSPVPRPRHKASYAPPKEEKPPSGSALARFVKGRLRRGAPGAFNALSRLGLWAPILPKVPPDQYEVYRRSPEPETREAWERTDRILAALRHDVEADGGHLLVAYVPSRMEVRDADWATTQSEYSMDDENWDRQAVLSRLRASAASGSFPLLDLTPALRNAEHGALGGPYFLLDGHWNALGHRTAAQEVERDLERRGWVPPCRKEGKGL